MGDLIVGHFSGYFLRALRDPKADIDQDGRVSLQEALKEVRARLGDQGYPQKPEIYGKDTDIALITLDAGTEPRQGRLNALLIGVGRYATSPALLGPENDARLFETLLNDRERVLAAEVRTQVLLNEDATAAKIKEALDRIATEPGTITLVFYSGHSTVETVAQGQSTIRARMIVPYDFKTAGFISVPEMQAMLNKSPAKHKIMIIDG